MKFFNLLTTFMLVLLVQLAVAQDSKTITGTVTDADTSEPIIGATVVIPGSTIGTVTDLDGKYELKVPANYSSVQISFIGYKPQKFDLGASTVIDANLGLDVLGLEEVVVTAIGIAKEEKALGYSVQQVTSEEITKSQEVNVIGALTGKVAGVQVVNSSGSPGGASFVRIRGNTSITGNNQPLIVIDGIPIDNAQNYSGNPDDLGNNLLSSVGNSNRAIDVNPNDIESMSVLKGAAASALYGLRAANGVIVITTKKGGNGKKGLNVDFSSSLTINNYNKLPELQSTYAQGTGLDLAELFLISGNAVKLEQPIPLNPDDDWLAPFGFPGFGVSGWSTSWGPAYTDVRYDGDTSYPYNKNGRLVSANDPNATTQVAERYNNMEDFFDTGYARDYSMALSGGNEKTNFRFSFSNSSEDGIVPLSDFSRTSIKVGGQAALSEFLRVSSSLTYVNSGGQRVQQGSNTSGLLLGLARTPITFDNTNGNSDPEAVDAYEFSDGSQRNYRGGGGYDNPYWTINKNPFEDDVDRIIGYTQIDLLPTPWLNVTYRLGADVYTDRRKQAFAIGSRTLSAGQIFEDTHFNRIINSDLLINADHQFSDDFEAGILVGHNFRSDYYQQRYMQGDGLTIPDFEHISNAGNFLVREAQNRKETQAVFGEARLNFKRMLYLTFSARNEWSSTLPVTDNSFFYPSASLGFIFTEALGLTDNPTFSFGKLRFSYAEVGSDAPLYGTQTYYQQASFGDGWTNGVFFPFGGASGFTRDGTLGNPALKPEKTTEIEVGADLRFFNGRVGLDLSYYTKTSEDLILAVPVAASTGYRNFVNNVAEIENDGIEAVLNITPVKTRDFQWDATINFTKNESKVTKLADGIENVFLGGFTGTAIRAVAGQPYGVIFGGQWLRDDQGRVVIQNNEDDAFFGYPIADDASGVIGDPNPDWLMGIRNTFSYKGFTLSGFIDIKEGGDLWNGTKGALSFFGMSKITEARETSTVFNGAYNPIYEGAVKGTIDADGNIITDGAANDITVPLDENWFYNGNGSGFGSVDEHYVEDGSYIRLRELTLSYSFSPSILQNTFLTNLDLSVTGRNLWLNTDYSGVDPDTNLTGSNNAQGLDYFQMPNTKGWTVSLKVGL